MSQTHPHSDPAKESLLDSEIFENFILGIPTHFMLYKFVQKMAFRSHGSYSGMGWVSNSLEKVLVVIICFDESLWQVRFSLSETTSLPVSSTQSPEQAQTELCPDLRHPLFLQQSRVPFYVKFSTIPQVTRSNLIKIICAKSLIRRVMDSLLPLKEKDNKFLKRSWYELEGTFARGSFNIWYVSGCPKLLGNVTLGLIVGRETYSQQTSDCGIDLTKVLA